MLDPTKNATGHEKLCCPGTASIRLDLCLSARTALDNTSFEAMVAGNDQARNECLLIEVVTRTYPVVAVRDPKGDALHKKHRRELLADLYFLEIGSNL
jgi:hypothetical protein